MKTTQVKQNKLTNTKVEKGGVADSDLTNSASSYKVTKPLKLWEMVVIVFLLLGNLFMLILGTILAVESFR